MPHLQQSLPLMSAQGPDCELVIVDYSCPDGTAGWVSARYPQATVVEVKGESGFHKTRALNLGARAARSPWLMFIDADVLLAPGFLAAIQPRLVAHHYLRPEPPTTDTWGTFIVSRADFLSLGGYDEVINDWGGEDDDLYFRLSVFAKCALATFPVNLLSALSHDDVARTRFLRESDRWLSQRSNAFYLHIKHDLMLLSGGYLPDPALLRSISDEVRRAVKQAAAHGARQASLTVSLPPIARVPIKNARLQREIVYVLELLPDAHQTNAELPVP